MKVLLASREGEGYFDLLDELRGELTDLEFVRARTKEEILAAAADCDVYFGHVTAELCEAAPKLRWVQAPSAGVEHVPGIVALRERDIIVTNARGAHGPSIGEHAFALLLALTRELPTCLAQQREHTWGREGIYRQAREIRGLTMGLLGYGAIGRGVAQRANGFELELLAVDARPHDPRPYLEEVWPPERLPELLERSDVVVVSTPLTTETRGLIDAVAIDRMKPDAYLIVVSRGGIVDEAALAAAMKRGHLAGVGLDVTAKEPLPADSPLWDIPNLIITPHMAGASAPKERRVVEIFKDNLRRYAKGEGMVNLVDRELGY
jgi:phosphoglycerate dehydrogenase-like enzyme